MVTPSAVEPGLRVYCAVTSMAPCLPPANCATMKPRAMRMPPAATKGIM